MTRDDSPRLRDDPRNFVVLIMLALGTFVFVTTENMPVALLTMMAPSLDTSYERIGLLVTGYGVLVAVTSVPVTLLTVRLPRRRLLCAAFGLFSVSTLVVSVAASYELLLAARVATALSHAVFWSLVATTATSVFAGASSGRVIAVVFSGGSLGMVAGVPGVTWIGQYVGWRWASALMAALGLLVFLSLLLLLADVPRKQEPAVVGRVPDTRKYRVLLVTTAVAVVAVFTAQTYVTPFLIDGSGFADSSLAPTLLVAGLAGLAGVSIAGWLIDRSPDIAVPVILAVSAVALLALYPLAGNEPAVVLLVALRSLAFGALGTAVQVRILAVAPGSTDIASAASSSVFNVGISGGAWLGGVVLASSGVLATTLVGGLVACVALLLSLAGVFRRTPTPPAHSRTAGARLART